MTDLPAPPVPATCDLRDLTWMPLDVVRLRDSELVAVPQAEAFRVAVMSWCVSWHQVPAASLPDDDATLARLMGFGRDLRGWKKVRDAGGLRGWVKHSDGRLYHPVVAEKACEAMGQQSRARAKREYDAKRLADYRKSKGSRNDTHNDIGHDVPGYVAQVPDHTVPDRTRPNHTIPDTATTSRAPEPSPPDGMFDPAPSPSKPLGTRTFADWRIMVGKRIFWTREEDEVWKALFNAEGWDEMTRGYKHLCEKKPEPAKIFLSDFQGIR